MAAITSFANEVRMQVAGAPEPLITAAVIRGCRELSRIAKAPRYEATVANIADQTDYAAPAPDVSTEAFHIIEILDGGKTIDESSYSLNLDADEIVFDNAPGGELTVTAVTRPILDATTVNAWYLDYEAAVVEFAKHWLYKQRNTPWFDKLASDVCLDDFRSLAGKAAIATIKQNTEAAVRVTPQFF